MLSFGGLLSEIVSGGSPGLNESNPGLVKFLGGAVFPVGLIMYVCLPSHPVCDRLELRFSVFTSPHVWARHVAAIHADILGVRIVLQGQELLTSNMMVSVPSCGVCQPMREQDAELTNRSILWHASKALFHGGDYLTTGSSVCPESNVVCNATEGVPCSHIWQPLWKFVLCFCPREV